MLLCGLKCGTFLSILNVFYFYAYPEKDLFGCQSVTAIRTSHGRPTLPSCPFTRTSIHLCWQVLDKRMLIVLITLLSRWLPWPWCLLGRGSGCRACPRCRWARRRTPFAAGLVRCPARHRPRTPWSQLSYHHGSGSWRHVHKQKKTKQNLKQCYNLIFRTGRDIQWTINLSKWSRLR